MKRLNEIIKQIIVAMVALVETMKYSNMSCPPSPPWIIQKSSRHDVFLPFHFSGHNSQCQTFHCSKKAAHQSA